MKRLELLKKEREAIINMRTLSYDLMEKCREWYDHEIDCIEKWGSDNPEVRDEVHII